MASEHCKRKGNTMKQILIIEDDKGLNIGLCKALKNEEYQTISCTNLKMAREQISCQMPDLILLDLNLPDGNGCALLREIRQQAVHIPIILLTANDTDEDIVNGLEEGDDDYITKPFSLAVLRARVKAQLRKSQTQEAVQVMEIGPYRFDFVGLRFCVNGELVELSKTEQKLLRLLIDNKGRIMERGVLVDRIWTDGADYVDENALSVSIKRLRDKLDAKGYIKTIYGVGYTWVEQDES